MEFHQAIFCSLIAGVFFLLVIIAERFVDKNSRTFVQKEEKERYQKSFLGQLPDLVVSMDIDTTRFYEYIWAYRGANGCDTGAFIYNITGSARMKINELKDLFKDYDVITQFSSSAIWRAMICDRNNTDIPFLFIALTHYNASEPYSIVIIGDRDEVKSWETYFLTTFQAPTIKKLALVSGLDKEGSLKISNSTLDIKEEDLGFDEFYPFIEGGIAKLAKDFQEAPESIMLLIGEWGTGKSTLIRSLCHAMSFEYYGICNNQLALKSREIADWIGTFEDRSLVALEDSDEFVSARSEGNNQMSGLLNLADGIIKAKRKIVISTNLSSVNSVDPALIRPGRTFMTIKFRKLTLEEANIARSKLNLAPISLENGAASEMTLAQALNHDRANNINTTPERKTGFAR